MGQHHEIYFVLLAFVSELIGTLSGVGSSTLFVPVAKLLESASLVLVLTASLHVLGNSIRTVLYRKSIDWKLVLKFGIPALVFTGIGAQYSDWLSERAYSAILGVFLIGTSVYLFFFSSHKLFTGQWLPLAGGGLSGLLTGMLGSGGAIRSLALSVFDLNPLVFIATSTLIDFGGDILRLIIYLNKGFLSEDHYFYLPILMVVALIANFLAKRWLKYISQELFKKIVLIFVFIMGVVSIISAFASIKLALS